jgi:hypothetical protein
LSERAVAPAGLVGARDGGGIWWVEEGLLATLRSAGWLDPARLAQALANADAAHGRAALACIEAGGARLALRAVRHGGALGGLLGGALAGPARPLDEIAVTAALRRAGAPVPRPAFGGAWRRGLTWRGVVATHFEPAALDGERLLRAHPTPERVALAIAAAARAVRRFHDAGGSHPDLHCKNLLLREADGAWEAIVIDLDRARRLERVAAPARMAQLMRLYRSLVKRALLGAIGPRGAEAFFEVYVAGDAALRDALCARLPAERRRLARHALLYRPR